VLWRDKQIEYTRLVTTSNDGAHYRPFWELTRAACTLSKGCWPGQARPGRPDQIDRLMNQYRSLSAFPENREVLKA
jgi:2-haloacid dehalogenase